MEGRLDPRFFRREATRTSISADAWAGTTLVVVPPWMTPTLMVVPAARSCSAWSLRIWWASSTIALRPCWGATPAWAALPSTSRWNRPTPFREVLSPPSARAGSSTKT